MSLLVSDHFKTQEMCNEAVRNNPYMLRHIPDHFKTEEMCDDAVEVSPWQLKYVPDQCKTQNMCDEAVIDDSSSLQYVSDWLLQVTGYTCGMLTVNIVIMMMKSIFLSGRIVIKKERFKKPQ